MYGRTYYHGKKISAAFSATLLNYHLLLLLLLGTATTASMFRHYLRFACSSNSVLSFSKRLHRHNSLQDGLYSFRTSTKRQLVVLHNNMSTSSNEDRHKAIVMDPKGYSARILPGGKYIIKVNKVTGEERKLLIERVLGFFWMIKDLRLTNDKPVLPNTSLIPAERAKVLPTLNNIQTLRMEVVSLPAYIKGNGCTLLAVSFKQFGFDMLPSWMEPFRHQVVSKTPSAKILNLHMTLNGDGFLYRWFLKPMMVRKFQSTTPVEEHDSTLLHFGPDPEQFRDALRMHNTLTGYVCLLDALGRVRWMSSGKPASDEEIATLIDCAKDLCDTGNSTNDGTTYLGQQPQRGKRIAHRIISR